MDINQLTIGQVKELTALLNIANQPSQPQSEGLNYHIGKKVIIRTYSAGVWFGELTEKSGKEVILKNARRLWYWKTANSGISLSEVANAGLHKDSKVCAAVENVWLEAIEILPCTKETIKNIEAANEYKA